MVNSIAIFDSATNEFLGDVAFDGLATWLEANGLRVTGGGSCWVTVESV